MKTYTISLPSGEGAGHGRTRRASRPAGFSLIELVIVVVIIGIIAAIAIPRMSRGSAGAGDAAVAQNLSVLRKALDMYQLDHENKFPDAATVGDALTQYSDLAGTTIRATKDDAGGVVYGPYMRSIPPLTSGAKKGKSKIAAASASDVGWLYDAASGSILPNIDGSDAGGKPYNLY